MPASLTNPAKAATDYDFRKQSKPAYRNAWIRAVCAMTVSPDPAIIRPPAELLRELEEWPLLPSAGHPGKDWWYQCQHSEAKSDHPRTGGLHPPSEGCERTAHLQLLLPATAR